MNVFVIPSWYPTNDHPNVGIFIREQVQLLARNHPDINFGISLWGSHEESLLLRVRDIIENIEKFAIAKQPSQKNKLSNNCFEYYLPTPTWTRKIRSGNINAIIEANLSNLNQFEHEFGPIDIIHAHVPHPAGFVGLKISKERGIPYVITEHMSPFPFNTFLSKGKLSKWIRDPLRQANKIIAVSHSLKDQMNDHMLGDIQVIPNFIDEIRFKPADNICQPFRILSIGRLEHQKNFILLLRALQKLVYHGYKENISLKIIGEGSLRDKLINEAEQLRIAKYVSWKGELDQSEIVSEIQKCSFFCLPSLHESFGIVLIEALACGKPIIATTCGGPEDIVNRDNGLLAYPDDPEDLANKMIEMIRNYDNYNPEVIREDFEKCFSSKVITPKIVDLYKQVIAEYKAKA